MKVREIRFYMDQRTEQLTLIFNPIQKFDPVLFNFYKKSLELNEQIQRALYNVIGFFCLLTTGISRLNISFCIPSRTLLRSN